MLFSKDTYSARPQTSNNITRAERNEHNLSLNKEAKNTPGDFQTFKNYVFINIRVVLVINKSYFLT